MKIPKIQAFASLLVAVGLFLSGGAAEATPNYTIGMIVKFQVPYRQTSADTTVKLSKLSTGIIRDIYPDGSLAVEEEGEKQDTMYSSKDAAPPKTYSRTIPAENLKYIVNYEVPELTVHIASNITGTPAEVTLKRGMEIKFASVARNLKYIKNQDSLNAFVRQTQGQITHIFSNGDIQTDNKRMVFIRRNYKWGDSTRDTIEARDLNRIVSISSPQGPIAINEFTDVAIEIPNGKEIQFWSPETDSGYPAMLAFDHFVHGGGMQDLSLKIHDEEVAKRKADKREEAVAAPATSPWNCVNLLEKVKKVWPFFRKEDAR